MNLLRQFKALFDARLRAEQAAEKARLKAEKARKAADQAEARAAESISEHRRINYNCPINFLGNTNYPELTPAEWAAKRAKWAPEEYASTDPDLYGSMGDAGSMEGEPYEVIEAEVRRRMLLLVARRNRR